MKNFKSFIAALLCLVMLPVSSFAASTQADDSVTESKSPRIIVAAGVMALVTDMRIYPAVYDGKTTDYDNSICKSAHYGSNQNTTTVIENIPAAEAQNLLQSYQEKTGTAANAGYVDVRYSLERDNKGSYGQYFKYKPVGNSTNIPDGQEKLFHVSSIDTVGLINQTFLIPENASAEKYSIGLWGAFYFRNAQNNMNLNHMSGFKLMINSDL